MKHIPTIARILLGLLFLVFAANFWLKFIPVPRPEEGSQAAAFMGAIYGSGILLLVKILELVTGILLVSGRFVNLALAILGPIIVVIALYNIFLFKGNYPIVALISVLAIVALAGRRTFVNSLFFVK